MLRESPAIAADAGVAVEASTHPLLPKRAPLPAKAKHVVHIFAQGAPSQVDTWDPKPMLARHDGSGS